jgi:hypothetical protein
LFKEFLPNADLGARNLVFHEDTNEATFDASVDESMLASNSQNLATFQNKSSGCKKNKHLQNKSLEKDDPDKGFYSQESSSSSESQGELQPF